MGRTAVKTLGSDETDGSVELPPDAPADSAESFELERLKILLGVGEEKGNLVYVLRAAEAMDFCPIISTLGWERLRKERRPTITRLLHRQSWGDFVLVLGISGDEVILVGGDLKVMRMTRERFCRCWSGWVVILQQRPVSFGA
jgi:ABC-type bacteriocin/lantibiotic exporter with double-glycine peptidase domain